MTPTSPVPPYPTPLGMLKGKTVVVTAAAGTGIGFAAAKRAAKEEVGCERPALAVYDVTGEEAVRGLRDAYLAALGRVSTEQIQCKIISKLTLGLSEEPRGK